MGFPGRGQPGAGVGMRTSERMSEFLVGSGACCRVTGEAGSGEAGISHQEGKRCQRGEGR